MTLSMLLPSPCKGIATAELTFPAMHLWHMGATDNLQAGQSLFDVQCQTVFRYIALLSPAQQGRALSCKCMCDELVMAACMRAQCICDKAAKQYNCKSSRHPGKRLLQHYIAIVGIMCLAVQYGSGLPKQASNLIIPCCCRVP